MAISLGNVQNNIEAGWWLVGYRKKIMDNNQTQCHKAEEKVVQKNEEQLKKKM